MVLFCDWSQQPAHHRPFCLSCCGAAEKPATQGHHTRLTVGRYFSPCFQTVIQITLYIKEQTHHFNFGVIYCLWKENTQKPWQCLCANWEQIDSHSMVSKVNREVWQLKVMDAFLTRRAVISLSRGKKKEAREAVLYSCSLFRGQQRSGFDKAAFTSRPVFDKSWMKPVLFVFSAAWGCSPFVQHVCVEWMQMTWKSLWFLLADWLSWRTQHVHRRFV